MNIASLLARSARAFGERPAILLGNRPLHSYSELERRIAMLAGALRRRYGLKTGDRVALVMKNVPEYLELLFAIWWARLIAVPVNAKLHAKELAYILGHAGARLCFTSEDLAGSVAPLIDELEELSAVIPIGSADYCRLLEGPPAPMAVVASKETAWLFYTSGTTGRPKGAMLTHGNLAAMTCCYFANVDAIAPDDCILHAAPLSHGSGLYLLPHVAAAAANVIPESGRFDEAEIFGLFGTLSGATLFAAPTMVKRLVDHPAGAGLPCPGLKTIVYGGGPMYLADLDRATERFGSRLAQIYGQGESPMTITSLDKARHADKSHPRHRARLASVGQPQIPIDVRVADIGNRALPPGEVGEVLARGPTVMRGYWRNPEASAETLRGGWLHTGDLGHFDEDGYLTLVGRSKELIISGGSNIYPREVEEVLLRHPTVAEVSVVGQSNADWGEIAVAFVVAAPNAKPDAGALDRHCLEEIARFKRPRDYRFVAALPKNPYGKVLKSELRRRLERRDEG